MTIEQMVREKGFVTATEAEKQLGVHRSTVSGWANRKLIRSERLGNLMFVHLDDCRNVAAGLPERRERMEAQRRGEPVGGSIRVADQLGDARSLELMKRAVREVLEEYGLTPTTK